MESDGQVSHVVSTQMEPHPEGIAVYNFQVDDLHDYFVVSPNVQLPERDASTPYGAHAETVGM